MAGLNCYLSLNYVPAPYTLVEGIRKLMPGHVMEWQNGDAERESYVPELKLPPRLRAPSPKQREELDDLLQKSVSEQLDLGRAGRDMAQRRTRLFHHPALRSESGQRRAAHILRHLPGSLVRRERIYRRNSRHYGSSTQSSTWTKPLIWKARSSRWPITLTSPAPMPARCRHGSWRR